MSEIKKSILEEGHRSSVSIHSGATKMSLDLRKMFWWPGMNKEIEKFMYACLTCKKSKIKYKKSLGLMRPVSIPEWKWDNISTDFVSRLSMTVKNYDTIWVIMDRLTKSAHFIPMRLDYPLERLAKLYIKRIVSLHDISSNIISDRDLRFMSRFLESLHMALGY